jgi:hypothetical protein
MTIEELLEIEAIRKLRLKYSYYLDALDLDALASLFTQDATCEFGPYGVWRGRAEIRANYGRVMAPAIDKGPFQSVHVNTNHLVELTGAATAVGRISLMDLAVGDGDKNPLIWVGVYDEAYSNIDGVWRIERSTLNFLWPKRHTTGDFPGNFPAAGV